MLAKAAKRVADTASCRKGAARDAAQAYARAAGVETTEGRRALEMVKRLERRPETDAAVREVTPEVGGQIKSKVDAEVQRFFRAGRKHGPRESHEAYAADALAELLLAEPADRKATTVTTHVVIDHEALVRGNALPGERCEIPGVGPVNVEWVRRLLGESFVTALVEKGRDITTVAHFGRHIPAHLRTALIVGGGECTAEGCHNRGYLELDHDHDFAKGGPAAWWNLDWYCSVDHDRKTRGWTLGPRNPVTGKRTLTPPKRAGP